MASLNRKLPQYTHEGAVAGPLTPVGELQRTLMSCMLWENTFYESGEDVATRLAKLVQNVPAEVAMNLAIQSKLDMKIRHAPLLIAVELCKTKEGKKVVRELLRQIITRVDDIQEFMAIYNRDGRKPLAKQAKLGLQDAFRKFDEYQFAKYNGGKRLYKLRDVLRIVRPTPHNEQEATLFGKIVKGTLTTPDTWEVAISATKDKNAEWTRLLTENKLGGLALLRNIRNMSKANVDESLIKDKISTLNVSKLLPINFIAAARENVGFEGELEKKFFEAFVNRPQLSGKTAILCDTSGSMSAPISAKSTMRRADVSAGMAMMAREMFTDCYVFTFDSSIAQIPARRGFALRDLVARACGGTDLDRAIKAVLKKGFERIIVVTDEQSCTSISSVNCKAYIINVGSYERGVGHGNWVTISGWSDKILDYISVFESR